MLQVRETKPLAPTQKVKVEKQNKHDRLPNECLEDDVWSTNVVSSMLMWVSCHHNPWSPVGNASRGVELDRCTSNILFISIDLEKWSILRSILRSENESHHAR